MDFIYLDKPFITNETDYGVVIQVKEITDNTTTVNICNLEAMMYSIVITNNDIIASVKSYFESLSD